jgi:short-subunit dehydrogenase
MNKKVLIIGGSSGLGRQLAILYSRKGHSVAVIARRAQLLSELKSEHPSIIIQAADISSPAILEQVGQMINNLKGLDLVIIAASIVHFNADLNPQQEEQTIQVNVDGFTRIMGIAWRYMKSNGGGHIAGITSIAAARGNARAPAYHGSKAFQSKYLESLRIKANQEHNNITITELVPGYMKTQMGKGDRVFWSASVEKAAKQAFRAIEHKRKRAFITKRWWLIYHIQKLLPIFIYDRIVGGKWKMNK